MDGNRILVAYDGSTHSEKALRFAVKLAKRLGGEVTTATVVRPPEFSPSIDEVDEFFEDAEKEYQPFLAKVKAYGELQCLEIKTFVLRGHPAESIVKYAFDQEFDLIITGTRGMGGFKSMIIGSVAQKIVSYSKVPVLVVK